jgi:hypothetical protein
MKRKNACSVEGACQMSSAPFAFLDQSASKQPEKQPVVGPIVTPAVTPAAAPAETPPNLQHEQLFQSIQHLHHQVGLLDHLVRSSAAYHDERLRMIIMCLWLLFAFNVIVALCCWCFSGKSSPSSHVISPTYAPAQPPPTWPWMLPHNTPYPPRV